jgi:hypothetical protein
MPKIKASSFLRPRRSGWVGKFVQNVRSKRIGLVVRYYKNSKDMDVALVNEKKGCWSEDNVRLLKQLKRKWIV